MSKVTMTEALARDIAADAANAQMRAAGRKKWDRDDYNLAVREYVKLWPAEERMPAMDKAEMLHRIGENLNRPVSEQGNGGIKLRLFNRESEKA